MAISTTDLKFHESQRMRDTADGGGAMSPNVVTDGELNNVFDDVSSEDRVSGRVSIRKIFPGVFSDNTDRFYGAGVLIIEPAADPAVDVLMTRREFYDDERGDIVERIQSYLTSGATQPWRLWNDHLAGTGALTLYGPDSASNPDLGDTWFLEDTDGVQQTEAVKIQSIISRGPQTFFDNEGRAFQRDVLVIQLSRPLQADWDGSEVQVSTTSSPPTRLRSSTVSAGARYYSTKKLLEGVSQGDLTVKVDNPFRRIVPTTSSEQPITDQQASLSGVSFEKVGSDDAISANAGSQSFVAGESKTFHFGSTVYPGSVTLSGSIDGTDNGDGTLEISGTSTSAEVDYRQGAVTITRNSGGSITVNLTATPGAAVQDATQTVQIAVTAQTQNINYVRTVYPRPAPGTVRVTYRSLGNWYTLRDNGAGSLVGESPGQGGGSVNYSTGTVNPQLAALPDIGTGIIISWGTPVNIESISGEISVDAPEITTTLANGPVKPGTVAIEYASGASTINLSDDGVGNIDIDGGTAGVGRIIYATGELAFRPEDWPDADAAVVIDYEQSTEQQETFQPTPSGAGDDLSFSLTNAPVRQGSVRMRFSVESVWQNQPFTRVIEVQDDGVGGFIYTDGGVTGAVPNSSINYSNGDIALQGLTSIPIQYPTYDYEGATFIDQGAEVWMPVFAGYATFSRDGRFLNGGNVTAWYQEDAAGSSAFQDSTTMPPLTVDLSPDRVGTTVAGSLRFALNGRTYVDRQGDLVYGPAVTTNAGTVGGTVDYDNNQVTITDWAEGDFTLSIIGAGRSQGEAPTARLFFRAPAAPIAQASLTIEAVSLEDGTLMQATADANGNLSAAKIKGFVDVENGIAEVRFGELVTAAGNEGEWWYDADGVDGNGDIWKPAMIVPGTARFSCVALTSIPLDPQILGLDPILLPSDGRVPVFNPGDSLMLVQRKVVEESNPTAGGTTDLGLTNVKWVRVRDDNGNEVLSEHYSIDGPTGTLTWANPLDLAAYTGPYEIASLSYFKRLCSDVQIDGTISLASGAPFAMNPADADIFLCSKLILLPDGGNQDLQALYTNLFTQAGWTNEWSDSPTAPDTTGQYDDINYPIGMSNNGAITERWRLEFVSTTTVNVIGERFGQVLTSASINSDIAPINPATSTPYFTIDADGWSGGWDIGDIVRFNTLGANDPIWLIRSTQPGDAPEMPSDRFIAHLQGDTAQE